MGGWIVLAMHNRSAWTIRGVVAEMVSLPPLQGTPVSARVKSWSTVGGSPCTPVARYTWNSWGAGAYRALYQSAKVVLGYDGH